jgi:hypothetical protein
VHLRNLIPPTLASTFCACLKNVLFLLISYMVLLIVSLSQPCMPGVGGEEGALSMLLRVE